MINEVRNTVLSILSKDNRGYITPFEFNLYAKQAQLEIFTNYMEQYSDAFLKSIARGYGEGYSDVPKNIAESLDIFYTSANLTGTLNVFTAPSDYYFLEKIVYNNTEVEKVSHRKILNLLASNLTSPSVSYPVYTFSGSDITVYPNTIISGVTAHYLRLPLDPKWTYVAMAAGDSDPLFNPSAVDYQDFELPMEEFPLLVVKILAYCGVSIRETDVVQIAKAQEMQDIQQNQ
jgi:hypothetical protein